MDGIPLDCQEYKSSAVYVLAEGMRCTIEQSETQNSAEIGQCGSSGRCKCCQMWSQDPLHIKAAYNGKKIRCRIEREATCTSKRVIYALTCPHCDMVYVGETSQELRKRMSAHRGNIIGNKEQTHLVRHFHAAHGAPVIPKVQILQTMDGESLKDRREAEAQWTLALNTAHPWGLNNNVTGCGAITTDTDPAERRNCPWFRYKYQRPIQRGYRQRKNKKSIEDRINSDSSTAAALEEYVQLGGDLRVKYRKLSGLKVSEIGRLVDRAMQFCHEFGFTVYQELASFQLAHHSKDKPETIKPQFLPFEFVNRHANVLNPDRILRTRHIYPEGCVKSDFPKTIFTKSFVPSLGSNALNYNRFLRELDTEKLTQLKRNACVCQNAEYEMFVDPSHGHVCTGNLAIIEDQTLRSLMSKGSTFRQTEDDSVEIARERCHQAIMMYIHKIVRKQKPDAAKEIYDASLKLMDKLAAKCEYRTGDSDLDDEQKRISTKSSLRKLQRTFVIAPVDKAANNFALVCPKFYAEILNKELGVSHIDGSVIVRGNEVYSIAREKEEEVIERHAQATLAMTGEDLSNENKVMPRLWASPKFHKVPTKFRFIAGAKYASTKQMSVVLAKILYHLKEHWERYTTVVSERKGYNCSWMIDNSGDVIRMLRRNKLPSNSKLNIADFSTLYTSFQNGIIIENAASLIKLLFKHSSHKYISIGRKAYYHSSETRNTVKYTSAQVIRLLVYLVKNSYVTYAGELFHQSSGIPMGANYSPVLANLCLAHLEYQYLIQNPAQGRRLSFTVRYIDDLLSVGSDALCEVAADIYPRTLPLTFDDTEEGKGHYLDLAIDRKNNTIGLFDKRRDFSFEVIRYTDAKSNVPRSTGLNIMYSQAIRLARICTRSDELQTALRELFAIMENKGFRLRELERTINNVRTKYPALFFRHNIKTKRDVARIVQSATT